MISPLPRYIERARLPDILKFLFHQLPPDDEFEQMISEVTDYVAFDKNEFYQLMRKYRVYEAEKMAAVFAEVDGDESGLLCREEIQEVVEALGYD